MTQNTERHLEIFKKHFRKGWEKTGAYYDWAPSDIENRFNEEWDELLHSDEDGQEMIKMVTNCMDEYHYEMSQLGDTEKQLMTLGGELVGVLFHREKLKLENSELKNEVDRLKHMLDVRQATRKASGLQIGSYKYRPGGK